MFTLLHSERPKLYTILASLSAIGLNSCAKNNSAPVQVHVSILFKVTLIKIKPNLISGFVR